MNIEITREELSSLLDLIYLADFVLTGHKTEEDPRRAAYEKLVQKFYALAAGEGGVGKVHYDPGLDKYSPNAELEESSTARTFLDEFTDETFWHELIYRFTMRDAERSAGGPENLKLLDPRERLDLEIPFEEKYIEEFEKNGIERLEIMERFDTGGFRPATSD